MATTQVRVKRPLRKARILSNKVRTTLIKASKKKEIDIDISDVVVGGSVAHGTALPGHFDIDLTVFSLSLHPIKHTVTEQTYKDGMEQIIHCLQRHLTNYYKIKDPEELYGNHGRRFQCWHFQVDLSLSPKWENLEDMYKYMKMNPSTRKLSASEQEGGI
ncbi:uncharacterized protein LOC135339823 [Halichondria panicea]|uniref:uncharacterized protein LOC135339823 n=1 Tax=Halichondria panicea TaxID=6063 RepID=UPI00312B567C